MLNRWHPDVEQASTPGPGSISTCSAGRRSSPTPIPACRRSLISGNGSGARSSRSRIQQIDTYLAWCYDPRLSTAAAGQHHAPWWKKLRADVDEGAADSQRSDLLPRADRGRGGALSATGRCQPYARRRSDAARHPHGTRRLPLARRAGEQARPSAVGRGDRQRLELATGLLRARSRTPASSTRRRARDSLLARVPAGQGDRQPLERPVPARQRDDRGARMAPVGSGRSAAEDPRRAAPLLFQTLFDDGPRAGDGRHDHRDGGQRGRRGIRPLGERPG